MRKPVYVNIDINTHVTPFLTKVSEQKNICREMLYPFVDIYRNTSVTDVLFDVFCQYSAVDTKFWDTYADRYLCESEKGQTVNYKDRYRGIYVLNEQYQLDPYRVWFERCHEVGLRPWLSVRMNDAHGFTSRNHHLRSGFYDIAMQNGWILGEDYGWFGGCYNYKVPQVRERMLGYIREQLLRYDIYGLELDFLRENQCFAYLTDDMEACTQIMNQFIREVKKAVTEAEEKWGHKIRIAARLMRDLKHNTYYGFDPEVWAAEKLVDLVIPAPRFTGSDSGIPVAAWKELLPEVEIVPGMETGIIYHKEVGLGIGTAAVARGLAASFLAQGADGIYFYNCFVNPDTVYCTELENVDHPYVRSMEAFRSCGSLEEISGYPIRFAVLPQPDERYAAAPPFWSPLPAALCGRTHTFEIITGAVTADKEGSLIIGLENCQNPAEVKVLCNGSLCGSFKEVDLAYIPGIGAQVANYVTQETVCYRCVLPKEALTDSKQRIEVTSDQEESQAVLNWLELVLI